MKSFLGCALVIALSQFRMFLFHDHEEPDSILLGLDSSPLPTDVHSSVIGMAVGYKLETYKRFVGSLRGNGFRGYIHLGIEWNATNEIQHYLASMHVTMHPIRWVECTYPYKSQCAAPYPDLKVRWSRYHLALDWLEDCSLCTGPVLLTDVRDVLFQGNPFDKGVKGLQLYAEHPYQTIQHRITKKSLRKCFPSLQIDPLPMICSGTTMGTRGVMMAYLEAMKSELNDWTNRNEHCRRVNHPGGDQAIHNYLYYYQRDTLPSQTRVFGYRDPSSAIATVGVWAKVLERDLFDNTSASQMQWDGLIKYNVTNTVGAFVQSDGVTEPALVHQYDRFRWLSYEPWIEMIKERQLKTAV